MAACAATIKVGRKFKLMQSRPAATVRDLPAKGEVKEGLRSVREGEERGCGAGLFGQCLKFGARGGV